jgi:hypothetical protein
MSGVKLDIAIWNYDRAAALRDGSVRIEGVDAKIHSGRIVTEIFRSMIKDRAYDVAELGLTYFLRTFEVDDPPFLLIPVFPVRSFRHSAIYINKASGIERPQDLNDKTIGELALYGHDAGVMPKGMLADEFGGSSGKTGGPTGSRPIASRSMLTSATISSRGSRAGA